MLWEKDLVAVYRLDQKSQRKQEENDTGSWQQKGRERDTEKNKPTPALVVHTRRQREETCCKSRASLSSGVIRDIGESKEQRDGRNAE